MNGLNGSVENRNETKKRLISIDFFKGLTIILMVFVNTTRNFVYIPAWSKHAGDFGLTYVDLIAPFFIFMMALNFRSSFMSRLKAKGRLQTYGKFIYRYLIFIGLGLLLTLDATESGMLYLRWGTLQVLGTSGLIALPFIESKKKWRVMISFGILVLHQLLLETPIRTIIYDGAEGGFLGALSWGAMMLFSTVLAEGITFYKEGKKKQSLQIFGYWGAFLTLSGLILHFFYSINNNFVISRQYMTISYSLISIGISSLVFLCIFYSFEFYGSTHPRIQKEKIISVLGKNSLILFIIHMVLIFITIEFIPNDLFVILAILIGILNIIIIWIIGYLMNKVEIFIVI